MENQITINDQTPLTELKALAYDVILRKQAAELDLQKLNILIDKKTKEMQLPDKEYFKNKKLVQPLDSGLPSK